MKKLWSPHLFKPHVNPDELINYLLVEHPQVMQQGSADPRTFYVWIVNALCKQDRALARVLKHSCRGKLARGNKHIPFWNLTLPLPDTSVFKDSSDINEQPQVELRTLLQDRFASGNGPVLDKSGMPRFLVLSIGRFSPGEFPVKSRNQTVVSFADVLELDVGGSAVKYRLAANIVHAPKKNTHDIGRDDESSWRVQLPNTATHEWVELDSTVTTPRDANLLFLSETYMQVWQRCE